MPARSLGRAALVLGPLFEHLLLLKRLHASRDTEAGGERAPVEVGAADGSGADHVLSGELDDGQRAVDGFTELDDVGGILDSAVEREAVLALEVAVEDLLAVAERRGGGEELLEPFVDAVAAHARLVGQRHGLGKHLDGRDDDRVANQLERRRALGITSKVHDLASHGGHQELRSELLRVVRPCDGKDELGSGSHGRWAEGWGGDKVSLGESRDLALDLARGGGVERAGVDEERGEAAGDALLGVLAHALLLGLQQGIVDVLSSFIVRETGEDEVALAADRLDRVDRPDEAVELLLERLRLGGGAVVHEQRRQRRRHLAHVLGQVGGHLDAHVAESDPSHLMLGMRRARRAVGDVGVDGSTEIRMRSHLLRRSAAPRRFPTVVAQPNPRAQARFADFQFLAGPDVQFAATGSGGAGEAEASRTSHMHAALEQLWPAPVRSSISPLPLPPCSSPRLSSSTHSPCGSQRPRAPTKCMFILDSSAVHAVRLDSSSDADLYLQCNRLIRTSVVLALTCMYLMWFIIYMAQLHPIVSKYLSSSLGRTLSCPRIGADPETLFLTGPQSLNEATSASSNTDWVALFWTSPDEHPRSAFAALTSSLYITPAVQLHQLHCLNTTRKPSICPF
ncbi:hypothetical protein L1887_63382 [Cichorium endivia]|nr:hypothetical protein L1887_63382 [Cichorium endivia]